MYVIAPELKDRIIALVKFSDERWTLESLQKGTLYLNETFGDGDLLYT